MKKIILDSTVGIILGKDLVETAPQDNSNCNQSGSVQDVGNTWLRVLKKFLIPSAAVIQAELEDEKKRKGRCCRPSELPIYSKAPCIGKKHDSREPGMLEQGISVVRKELWIWYDDYKGYRETLVEYADTARQHTESTLDYLKVEENYLPRAGAISLGGLTGLVLALRGGWFKRILYTTGGSSAMAALCYPREAAEFTNETLFYIKKYWNISYNFIYGVKPDSLQVPPMPNKSEDKPNVETSPPVKKKIEEINPDDPSQSSSSAPTYGWSDNQKEVIIDFFRSFPKF